MKVRIRFQEVFLTMATVKFSCVIFCDPSKDVWCAMSDVWSRYKCTPIFVSPDE